jgi:hypothetical protein
MRYFNIDTVVYETADSKKVNVKELRPLYSAPFRFRVKLKEERTLDEIAVRDEVYGESAELETYKLFDYNATKIIEQQGDLTRIESLEVPE